MPAIPDPAGAILALDVGDKRVGVACASLAARLPGPLTTLERGANFFERLQRILSEEHIVAVVVGLPRSLEGEETEQTKTTRAFIDELHARAGVPIHLQDEALTSRKAAEELEASGRPYQRGDIDALAATYILEDFLAEHADTVTVTGMGRA